jgi:hypothetical protein
VPRQDEHTSLPHIASDAGKRLMTLNLVSDWRFCYELTHYYLAAPQPTFISRAGGSDTTAVVDYLQSKNSFSDRTLKDVYETHLPIVQKLNGYYDKDKSFDKFIAYCDLLARFYFESRNLFFCNHQLLSLCFKDNINPVFYTEDFPYKRAYQEFVHQLDLGDGVINCYPYNFVEKAVFDEWTLFRVFSDVLQNRRVLIVSPFAESIKKNFGNRKSFFKNYDYPEFTLELYNTPITYADLPDEFYPDYDWFETLERIKSEISTLEFDVALLSCGSYAMPIGSYIQKYMNRKAVYVGGVLQLYFGIMGRRYDNPFFTAQMNMENFIYPIEREKFLQYTHIAPQTAREAFGAYF